MDLAAGAVGDVGQPVQQVVAVGRRLRPAAVDGRVTVGLDLHDPVAVVVVPVLVLGDEVAGRRGGSGRTLVVDDVRHPVRGIVGVGEAIVGDCLVGIADHAQQAVGVVFVPRRAVL